jgi:hypothetical protein
MQDNSTMEKEKFNLKKERKNTKYFKKDHKSGFRSQNSKS